MTTQRPTSEELEADIAAQRAELAETVDLLAQKLDVKAHARNQLARLSPRHVALAAGAVLSLGALVWWRRR
jgi:Protein of unknown function (DUF3618)